MFKMKKILTLLLGITAWAAVFATSPKGPVKNKKNGSFLVSNYENVLGTSFELKVVAQSEFIATMAEEAALTEIDRLANILSTYNPTSEISSWQKTLNTDVRVSSELFEVFSFFDQWKSKTGGALSASVGTGIALWKKAAATQTLPLPNELAEAAAVMNKSHWILNSENQTARHLSTDPLVLNSFVKGYILNKAQQNVMNVTGVSASTKYKYFVRGKNSGGYSANSNVKIVITLDDGGLVVDTVGACRPLEVNDPLEALPCGHCA